MADELVRQPDGTLSLKIVIPWQEIDAQYKKQIDKSVSEAEISGFRKGKAPRDVVEPKLDKSALMSSSLSQLLPSAYSKLVKKYDLKPILYPQIHIDKGTTGQDFEFTAVTCEAPTVSLPVKYKTEIAKIKAGSKDNPLGPVFEYLRQKSQISVPDLLIEEETNHRLSQLAENLAQLGLDTQKYLQTKKITPQDLRNQTLLQARTDLETELIINQIRQQEKLPDRPKTIDFLRNLLPS